MGYDTGHISQDDNVHSSSDPTSCMSDWMNPETESVISEVILKAFERKCDMIQVISVKMTMCAVAQDPTSCMSDWMNPETEYVISEVILGCGSEKNCSKAYLPTLPI